MKQLDMFSHQAELPVPMPAPLAGMLLEAMAAAPSTPVLEPAPRPAVRGRPEVAYRHPENPGMAWTGRGKPPRWVTEWIESGKSLEALRMPGVAHA